MNHEYILKTVASALTLVALLTALNSTPAYATPSAEVALAFTSSGQVLRFSSQGLVVSNGRYALQVDFSRANPVSPQAAESGVTAVEAGLPELERVTYANLWPGIDLAYDCGGGILRSTYTLAPFADPTLIRLRYNRAPQIAADGSLTISFDGLALSESAPLAWQVIDGQRVAVDVAFKTSEVPETSEVSFLLGAYDPAYPLTIDPTLTWNTFLGDIGSDEGQAIAVDGNGNVYVCGYGNAAWGSPVRAYAASTDAFVARLAPNGSLAWNTFLGGAGYDLCYGIAVDGGGNVYVGGYSHSSSANWGSPVQTYNGGLYDAFVAQLNASTGWLAWNTFLGGSGTDYGRGIVVDGSGDVYIVGRSSDTWGSSPVRAHYGSGNDDVFAAKLSSSGSLAWNTFLGDSGTDYGYGVAVDGSGNVYVAGSSSATWGSSPMRSYTSGSDGFAAGLSSSGSLTWNTFLGGSGDDLCYSIAVDGSGNVYVAGRSDATWGSSPVRSFAGGNDAFVARLASNGSLTWNTFLGSSGTDYGYGVAVDGSGNIYISGYSNATWGSSPVRAYTANADAFAVRLASDGSLTWNTFLGGPGYDIGYDIAVDGNGNVYVVGSGNGSWGSPVRAHYGAGNQDTFVARLGCIVSTGSGSWDSTAIWDTGNVPGSTNGVCVLDGHTVALGADVAVDWLEVKPGGAFDLATYSLTAERSVVNDGVISQTQTVNNASVEFLHIQNAAATVTQYRGLLIDSTVNSQNLGAVSVGVRELNSGEYCPLTDSGSAAYARRCYEISPATQPTSDVQVRLYARTSDELNGVAVGDLAAFRHVSGSGWVGLTTNRSTGSSGSYSYAEGDTPGFSDFLLGNANDPPTAVTLSAFSAEWAGDEVRVTWETALEIETLGFNLWRSTNDSAYEQVNASLVPAAAPGGVMGGNYAFVDENVTLGETYVYKLEELEIGGARNWYGPVSTDGSSPTVAALHALATEQLVWLPVAAGLVVTVITMALGVVLTKRRR